MTPKPTNLQSALVILTHQEILHLSPRKFTELSRKYMMEMVFLFMKGKAVSDMARFMDKTLQDGYDIGRKECAREIFEELEREINDALQSNYYVLPQIEESEALWNRVHGKIDALRGIGGFIDELKDKYTEGNL